VETSNPILFVCKPCSLRNSLSNESVLSKNSGNLCQLYLFEKQARPTVMRSHPTPESSLVGRNAPDLSTYISLQAGPSCVSPIFSSRVDQTVMGVPAKNRDLNLELSETSNQRNQSTPGAVGRIAHVCK
jgi:hypothetical protein